MGVFLLLSSVMFYLQIMQARSSDLPTFVGADELPVDAAFAGADDAAAGRRASAPHGSAAAHQPGFPVRHGAGQVCRGVYRHGGNRRADARFRCGRGGLWACVPGGNGGGVPRFHLAGRRIPRAGLVHLRLRKKSGDGGGFCVRRELRPLDAGLAGKRRQQQLLLQRAVLLQPLSAG